MKPALKQTLKAFDLEQYGGAPMLGLKGLVVKTHGSDKIDVRTVLQERECLFDKCVTLLHARP